MFLSRLLLNPRSRAVRGDLGNCQEMHRTILNVFPPVADGAPRSESGVLFRVEMPGANNAVAVIVQSRLKPDWSRLPGDYLLASATDPAACKDISAVYGAFEPGTRLRFRLRANPTKKIGERAGPGERRRNVKRVELREEDQQVAWLVRKAESGGFRIVAGAGGVLNVRVIPQQNQMGRRDQEAHSDDGAVATATRQAPLTFGAVVFEGVLIVGNAALFRATLERGIGSGKAYGFGLLSIARAEQDAEEATP